MRKDLAEKGLEEAKECTEADWDQLEIKGVTAATTGEQLCKGAHTCDGGRDGSGDGDVVQLY